MKLSYKVSSLDTPNGLGPLSDRYQKAIREASRKVAVNIETRGRADIGSAGKFGAKWTGSFTAVFRDPNIELHSRIPFFSVFETGKSIKGKPYLWLPLSFAGTQRVTDFKGGLAFVARAGKPPLLISIADHKPMFVGLTAVQIPKKFHIADVVKAAMAELPDLISEQMKAV